VKNAPGTLTVNHLRGGALTMNDGTLKIAPNGTSAGTCKITSLVFNGASHLDLSNNKLIVVGGAAGSVWSAGQYRGIAGLVQTGYDGGDWNGVFGIVTSQSHAISPRVLTALATMSAADAGYAGGNFGGISVAAGDQLVMYTWGGDANLDGTLNGDDYFRIDSHINQNGIVFGYHNGDFNYDGAINGDDYFIIDSNIATAQNAPPFPTGAGVGAFAVAAVPEPAALALVASAMSLLAARRRRSNDAVAQPHGRQ